MPQNSPKQQQPQQSVAGIAASFLANLTNQQQQPLAHPRSNSVNVNVTQPQQQQSTATKPQSVQSPTSKSSLTYSASSVSHRKPSFKFENNTILNRVHNMHMLNGKTISEESSSTTTTSTVTNKRASLNARDLISSERNPAAVIKRQQSVNNTSSTAASRIHKTQQQHQQVSLDSGIYSPSSEENQEDFVSPLLI